MKRIEKLLENASILFLVLLTGVVTIQVFTRIVNHPFIWTEELSRYSLVYLTFLGGALAYYKGDGLSITYFIDKLPPKARKANDILLQVVSFVMLVFIMYASVLFMMKIWNTPTTALGWNKGLIFLVVPVGFALIMIKTFRNFKYYTSLHNE
jgi:TRAP-type C4-dicarboxylate transport system permease small subunit